MAQNEKINGVDLTLTIDEFVFLDGFLKAQRQYLVDDLQALIDTGEEVYFRTSAIERQLDKIDSILSKLKL